MSHFHVTGLARGSALNRRNEWQGISQTRVQDMELNMDYNRSDVELKEGAGGRDVGEESLRWVHMEAAQCGHGVADDKYNLPSLVSF